MAYIGRVPQVGNYFTLDAITTSSTTTFNLLKDGVAYVPETAYHLIVSLNGVIQAPITAYTVSGSTIIFASSLSSTDSIDFITVLGDVLSVGTPSDGTVTNAKIVDMAATKLTGTIADARISASSVTQHVSDYIAWQSVQTSNFTAVAGRGYPINTTGGAITMTLPGTASVGDTIKVLDYARKWGTNKLTINPNSLKFQGNTSPNPEYNTDGQAVTLTYIDTTQGWIPTVDDDVTLETPQTVTCDFLVLAGGGSGAEDLSGGGGAGGLRSSVSATGGGGSTETALQLYPSTVYTITVGAGYVASDNDSGSGANSSIVGSDITDIVSIGGGEAGGHTGYGATSDSGQAGGCGGGSRGNNDGGAGTANQGFAGGRGMGNAGSGGGGTAAVGADAASDVGGNGGAGASNSITGSAINYGGGGGGGTTNGNTIGTGGTGGGGNGSNTQHAKGTDGSANLGGGGGGGGNSTNTNIASGGSGVVILRIATASYSGTTSGSPTVTTDGDYKVIKYTGSGSYTA